MQLFGRIPRTEHFRNVVRHKVETLPHALFLRVDESLFFGNLNAIESRISLELSKVKNITDVVLVMNAVNMIDTTAMDVLTEFNKDLLDQGIKLHFAEIKGPVHDRLLGSPLLESLSGEIFFTTNSAFKALS